MRAVAYLTAVTLKNRVVVQLRRLRSPRALVAAAAGVTYMYWFLFRPAVRPAAGALLSGGDWPLSIAALLAFGFPAFWWLAGGGRAATVLAFTPAEEHLLFPAPVSRRGLVHWKLWRAQLAVLFNTVLFTVLL
nr:putative ABC exporter domain-containing protein [Candidatus Eremiobacteraeota bacterium]